MWWFQGFSAVEAQSGKEPSIEAPKVKNQLNGRQHIRCHRQSATFFSLFFPISMQKSESSTRWWQWADFVEAHPENIKYFRLNCVRASAILIQKVEDCLGNNYVRVAPDWKSIITIAFKWNLFYLKHTHIPRGPSISTPLCQTKFNFRLYSFCTISIIIIRWLNVCTWYLLLAFSCAVHCQHSERVR